MSLSEDQEEEKEQLIQKDQFTKLETSFKKNMRMIDLSLSRIHSFDINSIFLFLDKILYILKIEIV